MKPREAAELSEMNMRHPEGTRANLIWNPDSTVDLADPLPWAKQVIRDMRSKKSFPALAFDCPTCGVEAGRWCLLNGQEKENRIHDLRRFKAAK